MRIAAAVLIAIHMLGAGCAKFEESDDRSKGTSAKLASAPKGKAEVLNLTEANFKETVTGGKLVVVDFWAPWCGPCRKMTPIIDRVADQFAGEVVVGKLNVDEHPNIAVQYDVLSIPRVLFFKGSETPVHQEIGLLSESALVKLINEHK